jgi:hypothetical protein
MNNARILWRSPHQLTATDRRALLLGVVPPAPSMDEWEASIRARWSDTAMTALTVAREAGQLQAHTAERVPGGSLNIVWWPQPGPQEDLIVCGLPEVFKGGARGGGKTDGVLAKWAVKSAQYGATFANGVWRMPGGGRIGLGYLDSVSDADAWQGRNLTDIWIEEGGADAAASSPVPTSARRSAST